ncbi:hypothetical protein D3C83_272320 [compost metagenome]
MLLEVDPDTESLEDVIAEDDAQDEGPDLLLRESARIVADMVEFAGDNQALARQYALLQAKPASESIN